MEKPTVENKVKEIAEAMGLTYLCESWFRANQAFDRFRRQGDRREVTHPDGLTLPACLYVQPVAGFSEFHVAGLRARRSVLPYLLCRRYAARLQRSPRRRRSPSG